MSPKTFERCVADFRCMQDPVGTTLAIGHVASGNLLVAVLGNSDVASARVVIATDSPEDDTVAIYAANANEYGTGRQGVAGLAVCMQSPPLTSDLPPHAVDAIGGLRTGHSELFDVLIPRQVGDEVSDPLFMGQQVEPFAHAASRS